MKASRLLLLSVLLMFSVTSVGCVTRSTPPAPDMAAGVYIDTAYEFYTWDEGLRMLIWHDATGSSMCDSSGSTSDPVHTVQCSAVSRQDARFEWQIKTRDGIQAEITLDGKSYDLKDGNVFLITTSGENTEIEQLERDLSDMNHAQDEVLIDFSLNDSVIGPFIRALNAE